MIRKRILITGIPGTGKTTMGDFLEKNHNYIHVDMEEDHRTSKILEAPESFISNVFSQPKDIVATWGFSPDQETIDVVEKLREYGFNIFWFDGNRDSARKATMSRDDFDENILNQQMNSLDAWNIPEKIKAKIVNVFDAEGNFRNSKDIAQEINAL